MITLPKDEMSERMEPRRNKRLTKMPDNLRINFLRGLEKFPGINMAQYADLQDIKIAMIPKVGTRTIRDSIITRFGYGGTMQEQRKLAWMHVKYISKPRFLEMVANKEILIVTRDPFERLLSCWKQKVLFPERTPFYFWMYYPLIRPRMEFYDFLRVLNAMPVPLMEKHFIPQSYYYPPNHDFVKIPLENLSNFLQRNVLECSVVSANKTPDSDLSRLSKEEQYFNSRLLQKYQRDVFVHRSSWYG